MKFIKMKFVKKFAALLFIAVGIVFANCGGGNKPVKIVMLVLGNRPTNNRTAVAIKEINKRLTPELNVEFDIRHIEWTDWQTRYQLALASGDSGFDLVITATDWLFAWEIVRRGGFMPMTPEMLRENAPRTWEEVTPAHWDLCTYDGKIWFIPEDQFTQYTNHGFYWRGDWGREGGVEQVTTFEELEAYFDAVKKNHPEAYPWDVDGSAIGGTALDGYLTSNTETQTIIGIATGNSAIFRYRNGDPYTVVSPYMDGNELIDAVRMFERWNRKGFWREDVLNYRGLTRDLMYAGLSGAEQHHTMTYYSTIRPTMDREQPGSDTQFFYFGMQNNNVNKDLLTHGAMAINAASKNPGLALQVYDLLRNDREIYMLLNYGIEGEDYVWNPDGTLGRPEGWDAMRNGLATNFWGGRMDEFEPVMDTWYAGTRELIEHLNSFAREYPLEKFAFDNTKVAVEVAAVGNVCASHLGLMSFGKTGISPEEAVANFRRDLRAAGYDKIKAEIQAQLDAFRAGE